MFDDKLGYDPDEWEECPEQEHFLVFGFFTRFLLSAGAILFAYYFFKLVDENKNKGKKDDEEVSLIYPFFLKCDPVLEMS